ncbi:MAG TPA: zinc ribbon domain-containing protein [Thermoanaerobaculaceae bacterium]|nr:zinc ribbon domain-containing protein [Thermoanaerobaculaceae bacterium]HRS17323.1 zinc ribbon domain-containing protein [Thermoanaerobaculaceae bacterium]
MPLYEYVCQQCGRRFEVLQRMGATAEGLSCPACGSGEVRKAFSTFASSVPAAGGSSLPCGKPSSAGCGGGFS